MTTPTRYDFVRYLLAKRSVDDRALNRHVRQAVFDALAGRPLDVLELGAGIGTMLERLLAWGLLQRGSYLGIDLSEENTNTAHSRIPGWAGKQGFALKHNVLARGNNEISASFAVRDVFDLFAEGGRHLAQYDLVVAHAFLDLVDIRRALSGIFSLLKPGGWFYFTINYDGETILEPVIDRELDANILTLYNRSMDERLVGGKPSGDSRTGRHLIQRIPEYGGELRAAGSSDWVVYPQAGGYPEDEAYFLHFIIHTIERALDGHPDLNGNHLADWAAQRRAQIESRELIYIAHQIDAAGRVPAGELR